MLLVTKISKNHYLVYNLDESFKARIRMNPRDTFVAVKILNLPAQERDKTIYLAEFKDYLTHRVGGNILIQLPHDVNQSFGYAGISEDARYVDADTMRQLIADIQKLVHVQFYLKYIVKGSENFHLLKKSKDYEGLYEKLFEFKAAHAPFVTVSKMKAGLYSPTAEKQKIANEFVKHFAIYDDVSKKFLACVEVFLHEDIAYISDLIVAQNMRLTGLAQALLVRVYEELSAKHKNLQCIWFPETDSKSTLSEVFPHTLSRSQQLNKSLQTQLGLRTFRLEPHHLLLQAANRSVTKPYESLDDANYSNLIKYGLFAAVTATAIGTIAYFATRNTCTK